MGLSNGETYRERLRLHPREIWRGGTRVEEVVGDRDLSARVDAVAAFYDLQAAEESLVCRLESGDVALAHVAPTTNEELRLRGRAFDVWARASFGLMGRSPDYTNSILSVFAAGAEYFGRRGTAFADNLRNYARQVALRDLCVSHCFAGPQGDRRGAPGVELVGLRIIRESDAGIVVSGNRGVATLAAISDELISFGAGRELKRDESDMAVGFAVPIDTAGLRLFCGTSSTGPDVSIREWPLTTRFGEVDSLVLFDEVLVPWERVFFHRDVETANEFKRELSFFEHAGHHVLTRAVAKADTYIEVAEAMAAATGAIALEAVQSRLGEMVMLRQSLSSNLVVAELEAVRSDYCVMTPAAGPIHAGACLFQSMQDKFHDHFESIGASGLVQVPLADALPSVLGNQVKEAMRGAGMDGEKRLRLMRVAADLAGSPGAWRLRLFDKFSQGAPERALARLYRVALDTNSGAILERIMKEL